MEENVPPPAIRKQAVTGESWRSMSGLTEKLLRFPRTGGHAAFSSFFWIRATRRAYSTEGVGKRDRDGGGLTTYSNPNKLLAPHSI
jgi:hypothetical protein